MIDRIFKIIGDCLIWTGYVLRTHQALTTRKRLIKGIFVQPVLLPSLSNLSCHASLVNKGTVWSEFPFQNLCDSRPEHQLAQDLGATVVQWRRCPVPTEEELEKVLHAARSLASVSQK